MTISCLTFCGGWLRLFLSAWICLHCSVKWWKWVSPPHWEQQYFRTYFKFDMLRSASPLIIGCSSMQSFWSVFTTIKAMSGCEARTIGKNRNQPPWLEPKLYLYRRRILACKPAQVQVNELLVRHVTRADRLPDGKGSCLEDAKEINEAVVVLKARKSSKKHKT